VLVLALLGDAMDIANSNFVVDSDDLGSDVGEHKDELVCATTQSVFNNNVALLSSLLSQIQQRQSCHQQAVE
jgi:hypothetical protein